MLRPVERFEVRSAPSPARDRGSRLARILVAGLLPAMALVGALATLAAIDHDLDRTARRIASYLPYEAAAGRVAAMLEAVKGPPVPEAAPVAEPVPAALAPAR